MTISAAANLPSYDGTNSPDKIGWSFPFQPNKPTVIP
jgi:hypothetical protein